MENVYDFAIGSSINNIDLGEPMKWNDRLRQARDKAGVSNTEIANACKVKPASVTGWMTGDTVNIEAHNLLAACRLLNVSPFWVMLGEDSDKHAGINMLPPSLSVSAWDAVRLISLYAQASEDGKKLIMDAAETSGGHR